MPPKSDADVLKQERWVEVSMALLEALCVEQQRVRRAAFHHKGNLSQEHRIGTARVAPDGIMGPGLDAAAANPIVWGLASLR
jgi:hypothetical protein